LLLWLLVPLLVLWAMAFRQQVLRSEAQSNEAHDRVLLGSAMVIAERIAVIDGQLTVDIPPAALDMLEVAAQDIVFYNVSCVAPWYFVAGSRDLDAGGVSEGDEPAFATTHYNGLPVRVVAWRRAVFDNPGCKAALVRVAETLVAREALSERILIDSTITQLLLILSAAALIVFGVRRGLQPLHHLRDDIRARNDADLSPIDTKAVPAEIVPVVEAMNLLMQRQHGVNGAHQRFVADASHQLKTPLAIMRMQADLALRQEDPARMRAYVEELRDSTETTARVVQQLLALLRSDRMTLHAGERVDLAAVAREAAFELLPLALSRSIELSFEGTQVVPVRAHAVLLHELVSNLIDNAIRYTPQSGRIRVEVRSDTDGAALLQVADSGPGIPPVERARVFTRFYRTPDATGEGCGLGLAIVQQIAERYGATVALDTAHEGGLLVEVRFDADIESGPPVEVTANLPLHPEIGDLAVR
jgi:two-component system, OmpR family, sensor histidine kinase TctE